jgi:multiple antibiotic resistance protein
MSGLPTDYVVSAFVTLFVVVEPIGLAPIFLSVTHELPPSARHQVALRACLIAAAVLAGAALAGDWLLRTLGISLAAFRIAGGLLLFSIASEMVLGVRIRREGRTAEEAVRHDVRDIAAFPLAVPLMAGPGAITATVLLAGQAAARPIFVVALIAVIAAVMASCLCVFILAARIGHVFGDIGGVVLSRLLGILLAALAVQFVIDGVRAVLTG